MPRQEAAQEMRTVRKPEPLASEHAAFRDAVLGKPSEIVTMREGLATVRVVGAALESAKTGMTVDL